VTRRYYVHDHLYSPAALVYPNGTVLERYEYDAYGNCYVMEPNFAPDPDGKSDYGNQFYFTGRELDLIDNANLKVYNYRHRYYDSYMGRFTTQDPLGITPNPQLPNIFDMIGQYRDGLDLYEYVRSCPVLQRDTHGLLHWSPGGPGFGPITGHPGGGSPGPISRPCGVCGPDVTEALRRFKGEVTRDFNRLPLWRQELKCTGMWGTDSWDVEELHGGPGLYLVPFPINKFHFC